jgi:hypothetical protein
MTNVMPAKGILWGTTGDWAYEAAAPKKMSAAAKNLIWDKGRTILGACQGFGLPTPDRFFKACASA